MLYYKCQEGKAKRGEHTMTSKDAKTIKRLEKELETTTDAKRRVFIKATINRMLHKNGIESRYSDYR